MQKVLAAMSAAFFVVVTSASTQEWNSPRARSLVARAAQHRAEQLADTTLRDYTATAHGYLTFLAQLGEGLREPPKIVKADELALEVYWRAPNFSKQTVVGRRDTLLLPTDIQYHRDHLGIVQNNFPSIIRIGDGDEVRDVPHPLSAQGLAEYDVAIRDSLKIRLSDRTLDVYEVRVRPKNANAARIIGAVYIDTITAEVVRMAFNFTRASYIDKELEDISIVLENALVQGRFWLPLRQEVEIRRGGTWMDYPARGIIRGRWEVGDYKVNTGLPVSTFGGSQYETASPEKLARHEWSSRRILDSLPPDVRAVTDEDIARVKAEARQLVRAEALAKLTGAQLAVPRVSDLVRVNRVEGLALGAGTAFGLGAGVTIGAHGRWGFSDQQAKGDVSFGWRSATGTAVRLFAAREYRMTDLVQERSLVINSLAAQEYGSDVTDPFDVRAAGVALDYGSPGDVAFSASAAYERHGALLINATPANGHFTRTIPALSLDAAVITLGADHPTSLSLFGTEMRWRVGIQGASFEQRHIDSPPRRQLIRAYGDAQIERPVGDHRLVLRTIVGATAASDGAVPAQWLTYLGGPVSAPGFSYHQFAAERGLSQHVEWQFHVPFIDVPLGRFGRAPGSATLAPFANAVYVDRRASFSGAGSGWYPSLGIGTQLLFDLVRVDVARGFRDGRWTFSFDVSRSFWSVL
ncbi:MAG: hypothetical protein M3081_08115 [Gemmatimonadota bacterium]|nr:hypothetical protein [Gemmatimonadota bacterium]